MGFLSQAHTQPCSFHPLGVYTNPPSPVPPYGLLCQVQHLFDSITLTI